jgi:hypothetical protein
VCHPPPPPSSFRAFGCTLPYPAMYTRTIINLSVTACALAKQRASWLSCNGVFARSTRPIVPTPVCLITCSSHYFLWRLDVKRPCPVGWHLLERTAQMRRRSRMPPSTWHRTPAGCLRYATPTTKRSPAPATGWRSCLCWYADAHVTFAAREQQSVCGGSSSPRV